MEISINLTDVSKEDLEILEAIKNRDVDKLLEIDGLSLALKSKVLSELTDADVLNAFTARMSKVKLNRRALEYDKVTYTGMYGNRRITIEQTATDDPLSIRRGELKILNG